MFKPGQMVVCVTNKAPESPYTHGVIYKELQVGDTYVVDHIEENQWTDTLQPIPGSPPVVYLVWPRREKFAGIELGFHPACFQPYGEDKEQTEGEEQAKLMGFIRRVVADLYRVSYEDLHD